MLKKKVLLITILTSTKAVGEKERETETRDKLEKETMNNKCGR